MAVKKFKPTTPARRNMTVPGFEEITKRNPERSLITVLKKNAGRNNTGKITVRHQGGGNRKKYRIIDFKKNILDVPATVLAIEYDPNRTAYIALMQYETGEKTYSIAPAGLKVGDVVLNGAAADIKPGNVLANQRHSRRYSYPQHRASPRQGRSARKKRRCGCSAHG